MKLTIVLLLLTVGGTFAQNKESNNYILFFDNSTSAKYFQSKNGSYMEYYLNQRADFNGNSYYARVRKYSWGTVDTSYFRKGETFFLHFDPDNGKESQVVPIIPVKGMKWFEADSSWSYEILEINKTFTTPKKKYKQCILMECKQLTNRDKNKKAIYHLFYSPEYGYVGDMVNDQVSSYLKEIIIDAKKGDIIGK